MRAFEKFLFFCDKKYYIFQNNNKAWHDIQLRFTFYTEDKNKF